MSVSASWCKASAETEELTDDLGGRAVVAVAAAEPAASTATESTTAAWGSKERVSRWFSCSPGSWPGGGGGSLRPLVPSSAGVRPRPQRGSARPAAACCVLCERRDML